MGLDDRDYVTRSQPGYHVTGPRAMTTQIMLVTGGVYALQVLAPEVDRAPLGDPISVVTYYFALFDHWYEAPWHAYQLLTYGFLHSDESINHILMNMFGLWMFGREVERRVGRNEFLGFYLSAIVLAGVVWTFADSIFSGPGPSGHSVVVGASGGVVAVIILFALNYPRRTVLLFFVIPMPMWLLGVFIVGSDLVGATHATTSNVAFTAHLGGAAFALVYFFLGWSPGRWLANRLSQGLPRRKPRLQIHKPDGDDARMDEQVDAILQKIQAQGQESLTGRERRILEKASRKYQRKGK